MQRRLNTNIPNGVNLIEGVFIHDLSTDKTELVSVDSNSPKACSSR